MSLVTLPRYRMAMMQGGVICICAAMLLSSTGLEAIELDEDCLLHPWGTVSITEVSHCLDIPPTLTVSAELRCEECGVLRPVKSMTATGYGECRGSGTCAPFLIAINYQAVWMSINIQNRRSAFFTCQDAGTSNSMELCTCPSCNPSPILISLGNNALQLTGPEDGVLFDLTADGMPEKTAWTAAGSDDAFLVLDRNENGIIDDGGELFGDATPQLVVDPDKRNGFEALAVFDDILSGGNEDGFINVDDRIFSSLRLWVDTNHNGFSEADEVVSLPEANILAIELAYRASSRIDGHGNEFRYYSRVELVQGTRTAWDVFFEQD